MWLDMYRNWFRLRDIESSTKTGSIVRVKVHADRAPSQAPSLTSNPKLRHLPKLRIK